MSKETFEVFKTCLICEYLDIDLGESDWSEVTPGHSACAECLKGHWRIGEDEGIVTEDMRKHAIPCMDFEVHHGIKK